MSSYLLRTQGLFSSDYNPLRLSQNGHPPCRRGFSIAVIHPALYIQEDRDVIYGQFLPSEGVSFGYYRKTRYKLVGLK